MIPCKDPAAATTNWYVKYEHFRNSNGNSTDSSRGHLRNLRGHFAGWALRLNAEHAANIHSI